MLGGLNTEAEYQGKIYHIQTEDGGRQNPVITSQVFYKGAILATRKTSYADLLKADQHQAMVRDLMLRQHKTMMQDLQLGKLLKEDAGPTKTSGDPVPPGKSSPGHRKPDKPKKNLDDLIVDYVIGEDEKRGK